MFEMSEPKTKKTFLSKLWDAIKPLDFKVEPVKSNPVKKVFSKKMVISQEAKFWDVLKEMKARDKNLIVLDADGDMWQIELRVKNPEERQSGKRS